MRTRFHRLLVVKIADLGDTILVLPAVRALRRTYPQTRIDLLTSPIGAELARLCPDIDRILVLDKARLRNGGGVADLGRLCWHLARTRYDGVLLLHHLTTAAGRLLYRLLLAATRSPVRIGLDNGTGHFLTHPVPDRGFGAVPEFRYALQAAEACGATPVPEGPYLTLPAPARERARSLLAATRRPFVVLHPGVGPFAPARLWPIRHFVELARDLWRSGFGVVVTGTSRERELSRPLRDLPDVLDLVGRTDLATLAAVLHEAALVVGSDCGVIHLAAALGRPTLALFGPTNVDAWRPLSSVVMSPNDTFEPGTKIVALTLRLPCSPCCYVGYRLGRPHGCSVRTCLEDLAPETVARLVQRLVVSEDASAGDAPRASRG
ncbi:MAG: glycosyltransferase family 9 protein [Thermomicrobium sp.]|nr:glycosyltransferase family 9 protein [Thermomicrobium sp.]